MRRVLRGINEAQPQDAHLRTHLIPAPRTDARATNELLEV
jgi:hypothetical protein